MFNIVKRFYIKNIYKDEDVMKFVTAGKLTEEEYETITGQNIAEVIDFPKNSVE